MQVVLSADMEAIAQITDVREVVGSAPEYWQTGRARMTDDVVAAVEGLLEGGADEVVVLDNHGAGAPWNILRDRLPAGARPESWNVFDLPAHGVDAMFQVGYHPPAGVAGFVPHTYAPGLRLFVDAVPIGESHGRIWAAACPLLGITGHEAHRATISALGDAPYLVVQQGEDPHTARPAFATAEESAQAIRAFARRCAEQAAVAPRPRVPADVSFTAIVQDATEDQAAQMAAGGWTRTGDDAFAAELERWAQARDLLATAMSAALAPIVPTWSRLDLSSPEAFAAQEPAALAELTRLFLDSTARMAR